MSPLPKAALHFFLAVLLTGLLGADWRLALLTALACVLAFPPAAWRPVAWLRVLRCYGVWLVVWAAFAAAYLRVMAAVGSPVQPQEQLVALASGGASLPDFWLRALLIVCVAPLVEEVIFRGYLFSALERAAPTWGVQLVVATLFGLAHGLDHALPIGVLSLLFGHLRAKHGALSPSIIAHALHNAVTVSLILSWPELLDLLYVR